MLLALVLAASVATPSIEIAGFPKSGSLDAKGLEALAGPAFATQVEGGEHRVRGASLDAIMKQFGFTPGPMGHDLPKRDKRAGWKMALVATAADGFQAAFSCAEVSAGMGPTHAFVIFEIDGKPIAGDKGPFRLIVPTDGEPSRSIWSIQKLQLVDLRAPAK